MNVLEAMKEVKNGGKIERKLSNGLTEVKEFYDNGQIWTHFFKDDDGKVHGERKSWGDDGVMGSNTNFKNGKFHGERKWWREDGTIEKHQLWEDDKLIEDYLKKP